VVGSYVPFREGVCGRQLCAFLVGGRWWAVIRLTGRWLVVGSYVNIRQGVVGRQLCAFEVSSWW
jgi:hypothetical protein